jgi:hypothetical protein
LNTDFGIGDTESWLEVTASASDLLATIADLNFVDLNTDFGIGDTESWLEVTAFASDLLATIADLNFDGKSRLVTVSPLPLLLLALRHRITHILLLNTSYSSYIAIVKYTPTAAIIH